MKFPKELYVVIDGDDGEEYFLAASDYAELCEANNSRPAAKYVLEKKVTLVNATEAV